MDNNQFKKQIGQLTAELKQHDISGFYFLINDINDEDSIGVYASFDMKQLPGTLQLLVFILEQHTQEEGDQRIDEIIDQGLYDIVKKIKAT